MTARSELYDLVGIGFGPANLAVAISNRERPDRGRAPGSVRFVDRQQGFSWHSGLLFPTSVLQVSFLKDLITMVNPQSRYSFLNYLHEAGRLHDFINLRTFYPPRIEFDKYYRWAAGQFADQVDYRTTATAITPEPSSGPVTRLRITTRSEIDGRETDVLARNISIGTGATPYIPDGVRPGRRLFHAGESLHRLEEDFADRSGRYRFTVVGSGQTAGDVVYYLAQAFPHAQITLAIRGFALKPQDDTHFVNELFFPEAVDDWYGLSPQLRDEIWRYHKDVTHSAVDLDLIPLLYQQFYTDRMLGEDRLAVARFSELSGGEEEGDVVVTRFRDRRTGEVRESRDDAVILATGYDRNMRIPLLRELEPWLVPEPRHEGYAVRRDYSLETKEDFEPRVYLLGYCEPTHGFSETLLSLLPLRSRLLVDTVLEDLEDVAAGST